MNGIKRGGPLLMNLLLCPDTLCLSLPRVITDRGHKKLNSDVFIHRADVERALLSLREPAEIHSHLKASFLFHLLGVMY